MKARDKSANVVYGSRAYWNDSGYHVIKGQTSRLVCPITMTPLFSRKQVECAEYNPRDDMSWGDMEG